MLNVSYTSKGMDLTIHKQSATKALNFSYKIEAPWMVGNGCRWKGRDPPSCHSLTRVKFNR